MRTGIGWLMAVAAALVAAALVPATALAQHNYNYEVPPSSSLFPGPFGHYRMEEGGFYMGLDGLYWRMPVPLGNQQVAVRGFVDADGTIAGRGVGAFVGSGVEALNTRQLRGPYTETPGFNLLAGWRFESGVVLQASWIHLINVRYSAEANLVPKDFKSGADLADTFLFSPVYNFPATFAGEDQNVNAGQGGSTFGIWNASSHQQIQFLQRFDQFELSVRVPVWMTERYRSYGLIGPRLGWIWERFKWRTVDADVTGLSVADDVAIYSNIVSNRLYGVHIGGGQEWFMGDSPAGAFSISLDGETGLFLNMVKVRSKYELGDYSVVASRARNLSTLAPMASAKINLWWYPVEAIQLTLGYDVLMYFNTVAAREPIDFNFGNTAPKWERGIVRLYHGISFGIGITF